MKQIYLSLFTLFFVGQIAAQRTATDTNPERPVIASSSSVSSNQIAELPGFPTYQNTGNQETDDANYNIAKEKWVSENKELYDSYLSSLSAKTISLSELPGFPQFINTGNTEQDDANYRAAKELWIHNNQDLYNATFGTTNSNNNSKRTSTK